MRAAHRRDALARRPRTRVNDVGPPACFTWPKAQAFGAVIGCAAPDETERRCCNYPNGRRASTHQRDIHSVLEPAGDELRGAVERIDQQELRGRILALPIDERFFRNHGDTGCDTHEPFADHRLRVLIGDCNRRIVGLETRAGLAKIDRQDRCRGLNGDLSQKLG